MKKIIKAALSILSLFMAGCEHSKHCGCCHHNHPQLSFKADALYKIVPPGNLDKTQTDNCITLLPIDQQSGFIHTSFGRQVMSTLKKFFAHEKEVVVLELDKEALNKNNIEIRPEANKPGGDVFPHLYGSQKIPSEVIKEIKIIQKNEHGEWAEKK